MTGEIHTAGGIVTRPLIQREGVFIREGFGPDESTLNEWRPVYQRLTAELKGHRILDIGANIGMFTAKAKLNGAIYSVAVEPEPGARSVLIHNGPDVVIASAVEQTAGFVDLYVPASGNAVSATTARSVAGRKLVPVPSEAFLDLVEQHQPTFIKTDCEGAELNFLDGKALPSNVKWVVAELHREHGAEAACQRVIESFESNGWSEFIPKKSYSFGRCWMVYYTRSR
jgi:FkbM family methyltransferase